MANKANRYALAELRERLVKIYGRHPRDVDYLVPLPQFRRPKTEFELSVAKAIADAKQLNAARPAYRRFAVGVKKVRRSLSRFTRWMASLPAEKRQQLEDDFNNAQFTTGTTALA